MGKKTRKRHRHRGQAVSSAPKKNSVSDVGSLCDGRGGNASLIRKIRHSEDPRMRHAALSAVLHDENASLMMRDRKLLQAVREQVMDHDIDCAVAASGCLSNYLAVDNEELVDSALTAGWMVLLIGRLQQEQRRLTESTTLSDQQSELVHNCLECLCLLVENNPFAMQRLVTNSDVMADCATTLCFWLRQAIRSLQLLVTRFLHSAWDDNADLLLPWMQDPCCGRETLEELSHLSTAAPSTPFLDPDGPDPAIATARMHAVGAWISAWLIVQSHHLGDTIVEVQSALESKLEAALQVLTDAMTESKTVVWHSEERYRRLESAFSAYCFERKEMEMERDIVQEQNRKKEPARLIARRLQRLRKEREEASADGDAKMTDVESSSQALNAMQGWFETLEAWQGQVRPCQLALEITANLTADLATTTPERPQATLVASSCGALSTSLRSLLRHISVIPVDATKLPDVVSDILVDLQSKVGSCMSHFLAAGLLNSRQEESLFMDLKSAVAAALIGGSNALGEGVTSGMVVGLQRLCEQQHEASASSSTWSLENILAKDLDLILSMVQSPPPRALSRDASAVICNGVSMLAMLLSRCRHSADVNRRVCQALTQLPNTLPAGNEASLLSIADALVVSEVLNAFMDIYGNDEHPDVFDSLKILQYFSTQLPRLKTCIRTLNSKRNNEDDIDEEMEEQWKETASNAGRFIQYMRGET